MNPRVLMAVIACVLCAVRPGGGAAGQNHILGGLSASDCSSIRAAYDANRHAAFPVDAGYAARNPGQKWQTHFDGRGFETTPDVRPGGPLSWSWGLELVGYGVAPVTNRCEGAVRVVNHCGQRIEYEWDEVLTEWYVNDARGLEHGYMLHRRPDDHRFETDVTRPEDVIPAEDSSALGGAKKREDRLPEAEASGNHRAPFGREREDAPGAGRGDGGLSDGLLQITLAVRGELQPRISADGRNVIFVDKQGAAVVNYAGLKVSDADGAEVPAWFEAAAGGLRLSVDDRGARYPLTIDPIAQQAYLKASNTGAFDNFAHSVAISGDTVVVGAIGEDSNATGVNGNQADNSAANSGAAYVFLRSGTTWTQQAYLKASNSGAGDFFGWSVAISGDTIVVGAFHEASNATGVNGNQADNSATDAGAAYVFVRNGTTWSQQAYLKASNTAAGDYFAQSVAISGDTVVVGAPYEDSNATGVNGNQANNGALNSGAAYVFVRSGSDWSQQAYLKASNTGGPEPFVEFTGDEFGWSVGISGDTVAVGAVLEDSSATGVNGNQVSNGALDSGAAYVFVRSGTSWSQQAYLKASNTGGGDAFGIVAISGDTLVVAAPQEDSNATGVNGSQGNNSAGDSGAAYVFIRNGTIWSQQAYLKASNTAALDLFGYSVAVSGNTVVVGATGEDSSATGVNGNQANNSANDSGAAYVFVRSGGVWSQQAYLKASNTGAIDYFGKSVGISSDTVVAGASQEDSNAAGVNGNQADDGATYSGAAYVFIGVGCPTIADMNCDCAVNALDVGPFVLALLDPAGYAATYPACNILHADTQPDGNVDGDDVQGFVDLLIP